MFMNVRKKDIMNALGQGGYISQRILAEQTGNSLGIVNQSLKELMAEGYIHADNTLTEKGHQLLADNRPRNAMILAAGYGIRMVPINTETPKGLLTVYGERLIERLIRQLHEAGVQEIYVVVGFMKEQYEYLIDRYGVKLVANPEYATKNNLHSLKLLESSIERTYVMPCDIWCAENPFRNSELYSWYMVTDQIKENSSVRVNRKMEIVPTKKGMPGNHMVGIAYLCDDAAKRVRDNLRIMSQDAAYDEAFWEDTLHDEKWMAAARVVSAAKVVEINTYEQLRNLDDQSDQLKTDAIHVICKALSVKAKDIVDITVLKKGMTNRSFLFCCKGKKYIMRIPGEGTGELINRAQEAQVYQKINNVHICDDIAYMNPANGYKITEYLNDARVCDPESLEDLSRCMKKLREFHNRKLQVDHTFDIFERIDFYQSLWGAAPSSYADYQTTKDHVLSLRSYIDAHKEDYVLTHIDAVPDNFLFTKDDADVRLIDWEYAGMQDPHVDIAMFCIYALYEKPQVDRLIDLYFDEGCTDEVRIKIYCYIAACGLLWSNWCEYKRNLGVEFGEYSLRQYRYAKDYFRIVQDELKRKGME